jgi:transglutaminase-like putative cysteine protease
LKPAGRTRVWLPTPLVDTPYQHTLGDTYRADGGFVEMVERPVEALDMVVAEWPDGVAPVLELTSRVSTRDVAVDLTDPKVPPADTATLTAFLRPTKLMPLDGPVKKTADQITRGAGTDLDRARAIYDWTANRAGDAEAAGCGAGDIRAVLDPDRPPDKSTDLSVLFAGLARASGIPARVVYGLRVAPPRAARRLGLSSTDATRGQECRAEAYLVGFGWVPVEPRTRQFGSWEMNWIAYNYNHDVVLPGAKRGTIGCFMHPQAETADGRLDSLDPDAFRYTISVRETT